MKITVIRGKTTVTLHKSDTEAIKNALEVCHSMSLPAWQHKDAAEVASEALAKLYDDLTEAKEDEPKE